MRWKGSLSQDMAFVLSVLGAASAWYWNRFSSLDHTVIYFFAPFVLGAMIAWERRNQVSKVMLVGYSLAVACSLLIDYRPRLVVALFCGAAIWSLIRYGIRLRSPAALVWLGKISYSLFVSHYLVLSLTMEALDGWMADSPFRAVLVMLTSFVASLIAAACLYYRLELPLQKWLKGASKPPRLLDVGNTPRVRQKGYGFLGG
jgi:peptidoglycan/LPS O-acetylase OafA/YrhL